MDWVPVARDFSRHVYHSARWAAIRDLAMKREVTTQGFVPSGMCELCFSHGLYRPAKVVHHIVHITPENVDDPGVTLNADNLMRLCQDCHAAVHSSADYDGPSRYHFDEAGNIVRDDDGWLY